MSNLPDPTQSSPLYSNNHPEDLERLKKVNSPMTAIRAHCMNCMGGDVRAIRECASSYCALYAFRLGKNPYAKPRGNPQKGSENLKKHREEKKQLLDNSSSDGAMSALEAMTDSTDMTPAPEA